MSSSYGVKFIAIILLLVYGGCEAFQSSTTVIRNKFEIQRRQRNLARWNKKATNYGNFFKIQATKQQNGLFHQSSTKSYNRSAIPILNNYETNDTWQRPPRRSKLIFRFIQRWNSLITTLKQKLSRKGSFSLKQKLLPLIVGFVLAWSSFMSASWAAPSGGRMGGGSFGGSRSQSSPSMGRTTTMPRSRVQLPPSRVNVHHHHGNYGAPRPIIVNSFSMNRGWYPEPRIVNFRTRDILVVAGVGSLLAYGFRNNYRVGDDNAGPLGSGTTVGSLTVALEVPDRNDPDNILSKLTRISRTANTATKEGVQELLSLVSLELLRQEKSIASAYAESRHFTLMGDAERDFHLLSVQSRSKVDRLTINKFGTTDRPDSRATPKPDDVELPYSSTLAIVTINYAIDGDSTKMPLIRNREDLRAALSKLSTDAQVGDCLITTEIIWTPEDPHESLSREATYVDFPFLVPL